MGHDATTLGGWDVATGERLWTITPQVPGDFNVPTPLIHKEHLIVVTEKPELSEKEPNDLLTQAQPVTGLPAVVNGRLDKAGDVDSCCVWHSVPL